MADGSPENTAFRVQRRVWPERTYTRGALSFVQFWRPLRWQRVEAGADADGFWNSMKFRKFIGRSSLALEQFDHEILNHALFRALLVLVSFVTVRHGFFSGRRFESVSNPCPRMAGHWP